MNGRITELMRGHKSRRCKEFILCNIFCKMSNTIFANMYAIWTFDVSEIVGSVYTTV